jgi:hypothetical protein
MKCAVEMDSVAMMCIPGLMNIGSGFQTLIKGAEFTDTQNGVGINIL